MTPRPTALCALAAFTSFSLSSARALAQRSTPLDVVLVGGRVLDPETGLDAVRHVGIRGGRIAVLAPATRIPAARDTVYARGLVVAPGFIDLHAHGQDSINYKFLARDGVTTALELEIGTYPVAPWYAKREGKALINFGISVGHPGARRAMLDSDSTAEGADVIGVDGRFVREPIEPARLSELDDRVAMGIRDGALGIGMGINYTPAATRDEIRRVFTVAARHKVPVFAHLRSAGLIDASGGVAGVQEVIADAATTGASLHVVHVTSMGLGATPTLLDLINGARARGMDVTTEAYPYTAGATYLQSAIFDPGFEQRLGITYSDILWPPTGERLTAETFAKYRKEGGLAVIFMIPEAAADQAYRDANVIVASDGGFAIVKSKPLGHPRSAGTHARVLGRFVRERSVLSLMDAVGKMTLLPARRLESVDPAMRRKGRVQVGADADLTVFDPARVIDIATFENPAQYSVGIVHVLVNGTFVVRGEQLVSGVAPGRGVRGSRTTGLSSALSQRDIAFTHVTVIEGTDSTPRRDQTVIIRGNRIVTVAPSRSARVPAGARVVVGRGKFLIPGLWDMHVHTATVGGREVLPLYVANGVTGVRDMAGEWATVTALREDIAHGRVVGPRILASGPYLEGGDVPIPHILARTPDEARAGVDSLVKLGVDFVKVHSQLKPETYFAIARRARERGIAFAGHVPRVVGSASASDSGQRSIEHLLAIPAPCTPAESIALQPRFTVQGALGRCSSQDLAELYARFVRNDTWVTPTFVAQYEVAAWPGRAVPGDSLAHYLPVSLRRYVAEIFPMPDSIPPGADSVGRAMFAKRLEQVATMHRAGVRILTGTDAPLRNSPPGFGLHEELLLLARGGLSPFEIIRAATLEPARYFGMRDSAGTIAPGQLADLVLLDANPLRDIRNTRRIAAVVANGRLYDAKDRARLLRSGVQPADLAARIARIETGLRFPVAIRGRPSARMRLDQRMRDHKVPGVSIAVIDSFRIAWARGYGVRETGGTDTVTTETLFQAASISKPIAALAALRMVQEGALDLDEDVNRKLKSWKVPENRFTTTHPVTLRRLLSHSAGLTVHGFRGYAATEQLPTLVQMLDSQPPTNSAPIRADTFPGARWRYSGGGYTVMQQLLIDVSGRPFPELMRARVLGPLGMAHSTYEQPLSQHLLGKAASGHRSYGTMVKGKWHTYPEMAAAGLWTTPSDIARYAIHVSLSAAGRTNSVLSQAATTRMLTVQSGTHGLGPGLGGQGRDASFSHGGANEGFRGFFIAFPERGQGAVIMTNSDAGSALASEILRAIAEEYRWPSQRPVEKTVVAVPPETPKRIAGRYALETAPNIFITITADSGRVLAEVTGQFKTEIYPESEFQYYSVDRDVEFAFSPADTGKITSLVAQVRSGGTFKAKRVD